MRAREDGDFCNSSTSFFLLVFYTRKLLQFFSIIMTMPGESTDEPV